MPDVLSFTHHEHKVMEKLLDPTRDLKQVIPETIDHLELWDHLKVACKVAMAFDLGALKLRPLIGRMLRVIQEHPKFYTDRGYDTYERFIVEGVIDNLGLSRTVAYQAMRLTAKFPTLSPDRWAVVGPSKLTLLATFTDETQPSCEKHLHVAETKTLSKLREYAEENGYINHGEGTPAAIVIHTTKEIRDTWEQFILNGGVIGMCGEDKGRILLAMMQECASSWFTQEPVLEPEVVPT